jgi:hemerythrin-like domain-containing protein
MATARQTTSDPAVRDSDAVAMIEAAHRQQEARVTALLTAARSLAAGRGGADEVREVADCAAFLERCAQRHVPDEEQSLLPALARRGGTAVAPLIARITAEHRQHDAAHRQLAAAIAALPADGHASAATASELLVAAIELGDLYRAHLAIEEAELVPALRKWLTPEELQAAATEIQARRGPPSPRSQRAATVAGHGHARPGGDSHAKPGGNGQPKPGGNGVGARATATGTGNGAPTGARKAAPAKGAAKKPATKRGARPVARMAAKAAARATTAAGARAKGAAKAVARPVAKSAARAVARLAAKAAKAVVRPAAKGAARAVVSLAAKGAAKSTSKSTSKATRSAPSDRRSRP